MKKIKITLIAATFCAAGYMGYTAYQTATMTDAEKFMLANIEALTSGEPNNPTPCKDTGYKKWYGTSNVPTARKEYFHDCFCNDKEGYDPQDC